MLISYVNNFYQFLQFYFTTFLIEIFVLFNRKSWRENYLCSKKVVYFKKSESCQLWVKIKNIEEESVKSKLR